MSLRFLYYCFVGLLDHILISIHVSLVSLSFSSCKEIIVQSLNIRLATSQLHHSMKGYHLFHPFHIYHESTTPGLFFFLFFFLLILSRETQRLPR
ncbi:hypothetical protein RchiOBHm_Chr4g0417211 [Rosa chinensis]|uniref:Uncharacterized protein n=1 Tax=Rosa chinensis TaxID=74649 RepID=A0A2P6QX29_ROSCH|nr:hypothetical protein RchiOBHm_Chr4g0417211 [Rosa chinensis]